MFIVVEMVPLCTGIALSILNFTGAALTQAREFHNAPDMPCKWWKGFVVSESELLATGHPVSHLLLYSQYLCGCSKVEFLLCFDLQHFDGGELINAQAWIKALKTHLALPYLQDLDMTKAHIDIVKPHSTTTWHEPKLEESSHTLIFNSLT